MKHNYDHLLERLTRSCISLLLPGSIILSTTSCFLKQDRTTTVYGTIKDQNGEPVDSILVVIQGSKYVNHQVFNQIYTDKKGYYELVADVPNKSHSANALIPFSSKQNSKFENGFKDYVIFKNDIKTNDCCNAIIGQKTKYDFQLIPK